MIQPHKLCKEALQSQAQEQANNSDETVLQRLNALLLICSGMSCKSVSELSGTHVRTIQRWVRNYESQGIDGLKNQKKDGRPSTISEQQWKSLKKDFAKGPLACDVTTRRARNWSVPQLAEHLGREYGITFSLRQYQRLIVHLRGNR